jgi:hypothetical protein
MKAGKLAESVHTDMNEISWWSSLVHILHAHGNSCSQCLLPIPGHMKNCSLIPAQLVLIMLTKDGEKKSSVVKDHRGYLARPSVPLYSHLSIR